MCANSLYVGGPKTLLTDQHLLRTNFFFVTETSDLRLAGLSAFLPALRPSYLPQAFHIYENVLCFPPPILPLPSTSFHFLPPSTSNFPPYHLHYAFPLSVLYSSIPIPFPADLLNIFFLLNTESFVLTLIIYLYKAKYYTFIDRDNASVIR